MRDYVERGGRGEEQIDVLTPRELEMLKLIAEAYASKQISKTLFISVKAVGRHRQNIVDELGMSDRIELTRYAIRRGLAALSSRRPRSESTTVVSRIASS